MRLVSFSGADGTPRAGAVIGERVLDITEWCAAQPLSETARRYLDRAGALPPAGGLLRWLHGGTQARQRLADHLARHASEAEGGPSVGELRLLAPIPRPGKIIGVGRNYADHAKETGVAPFEKPRIIFKMSSAVSAPDAPVQRPPDVSKMDFEAELAVVIGEYAHRVTEQDALSLVAGYTILNDLSAREFQFDVTPAQTTFAKSMDGFAPMGPWLVTADEIDDPQALELRCWLNDQQMQHGHTADMLFPVATLIAYLSRFMTLEPGDVVTTGTPAGIGAFRDPPVYLEPGDRLRFEISGIGTLSHRIA